jgi:hypothetical protein
MEKDIFFKKITHKLNPDYIFDEKSISLAKEIYIKYGDAGTFYRHLGNDYQKPIDNYISSVLINKDEYKNYRLTGVNFFKMFFENVNTNQVFEWYIGKDKNAFIITKL